MGGWGGGGTLATYWKKPRAQRSTAVTDLAAVAIATQASPQRVSKSSGSVVFCMMCGAHGSSNYSQTMFSHLKLQSQNLLSYLKLQLPQTTRLHCSAPSNLTVRYFLLATNHRIRLCPAPSNHTFRPWLATSNYTVTLFCSFTLNSQTFLSYLKPRNQILLCLLKPQSRHSFASYVSLHKLLCRQADLGR